MMNTEPHNIRSSTQTKVSVIPKGYTIGLAILAVLLSTVGYGFRLAFGEPWQQVVTHAVMIIPTFVLGFPLLMWLGAKVFTRITGNDVHHRNAITLGLLLSCVTMLWLMGTYS